jgi:polyketide cyclase/dehydrase/lipid transport protein
MRVNKTILIRGSIERIFDIVTTAKYWPEWHPDTISVSGATGQPMRRGDKIRERARISGIIAENEWTVTEHKRPSRVVLKMPGTQLGDLRIAYRFQARRDDVEFTRELEFNPSRLPVLTRTEIERQMDSDSEIGIKRLKELVEGMLTNA